MDLVLVGRGERCVGRDVEKTRVITVATVLGNRGFRGLEKMPRQLYLGGQRVKKLAPHGTLNTVEFCRRDRQRLDCHGARLSSRYWTRVDYTSPQSINFTALP